MLSAMAHASCRDSVPLEDHQSPERLALVRAEIDHVLGVTDAGALADWADDPWHSPVQ